MVSPVFNFASATLNHPAGSGIAEGDYAITIDEYDEVGNIPEWSGYMNWGIRDMDKSLRIFSSEALEMVMWSFVDLLILALAIAMAI